MKIGDLVRLPRHGYWGDYDPIGIVVKLPWVGPNGETQQTPRVGVLWSDGNGKIDWEPLSWLVEAGAVNETR